MPSDWTILCVLLFSDIRCALLLRGSLSSRSLALDAPEFKYLREINVRSNAREAKQSERFCENVLSLLLGVDFVRSVLNVFEDIS